MGRRRKAKLIPLDPYCPPNCACEREIARWQAHILEHDFDPEAMEDQSYAILTYLVCAARQHPEAEIRAYCRWQRDGIREVRAKAGWPA
jgi:hypothetical protein